VTPGAEAGGGLVGTSGSGAGSLPHDTPIVISIATPIAVTVPWILFIRSTSEVMFSCSCRHPSVNTFRCVCFVTAASYCQQDQQQDYMNTQESGGSRHGAAPPEWVGTFGAKFGPNLGSKRTTVKRRQFLTQSRNMVTFIPMGDVGIRKVEERLDDILWSRNRATSRYAETGPGMIITPYS
jgi:hypothetical protein